VNRRAVLAIVRKDLRTVGQSKGVMLPLVLVPLVILGVMPAVVSWVPSLIPPEAMMGVEGFLARMPEGLRAELSGLEGAQRLLVLVLVYFFAPMYLIVPLMVASVIAADSFAGEVERRTAEALLYTPTTDGELFLGKVLAAWLPALGVGLGGFLLYGLVVDLCTYRVVGRLLFPNPMWLVLLVWVAPAVAGLGLGTMVLVSSRVRTFQEAYQLGGAVVLPVLFLVVGQITGVLYFSLPVVALLGLLLWAVDAGLLWYGARTFRREALITRL
jgi:ABC-type Na+ efflux pump permease subunit